MQTFVFYMRVMTSLRNVAISRSVTEMISSCKLIDTAQGVGPRPLDSRSAGGGDSVTFDLNPGPTTMFSQLTASVLRNVRTTYLTIHCSRPPSQVKSVFHILVTDNFHHKDKKAIMASDGLLSG